MVPSQERQNPSFKKLHVLIFAFQKWKAKLWSRFRFDSESTVKASPATTARELNEKFNVRHTTVQCELKRLGNWSQPTCHKRIASIVSIVAFRCFQYNLQVPFWTGFLLVIWNRPFNIMLIVIISWPIEGKKPA